MTEDAPWNVDEQPDENGGGNVDYYGMTLGGLIDCLNAVDRRTSREASNIRVYMDFDRNVIVGTGSWRGHYPQLALRTKNVRQMSSDDHKHRTLQDVLALLENTVGSQQMSWKSGKYTMTRDSDVYVATRGVASKTAVVGVYEQGNDPHRLILQTRWKPRFDEQECV